MKDWSIFSTSAGIAPQIAEVGEPRSKVVDGDPDASPADAFELSRGALLIGRESAFGELDLDAFRLEPVLVAGPEQLVVEPRLRQVERRGIHRHCHRVAAIDHAARRAQRVVEYPVGQRMDQRRLLGQRDELAGRDVAEFGVLPADQRLGPVTAARREVDARLEVERELSRLGERSRQIGENAESADMCRVAAVVVERHTLIGAPAVLCGHQRRTQHLRRVDRRRMQRHQSDAHLGADRDVVHLEVAGKAARNFPRQRRYALGRIVPDNEGKAQHGNLVDRHLVRQHVAQPHQSGADEVLGEGVAQRAQYLVVVAGIGERHQHQHAAAP